MHIILSNQHAQEFLALLTQKLEAVLLMEGRKKLAASGIADSYSVPTRER